MKILALDIGDKWIGSAISDALNISAKPFKTISADELINFLQTVIQKFNLKAIVIGYPKTLRGTHSQQTEKIIALTNILKQNFPDKEFVLWDERLTSKQAATFGQEKSKENKLRSHSIAAALILQSYLDYISFKANNEK